jgi:asparagine synthase (glutamine-hydrolysing)
MCGICVVVSDRQPVDPAVVQAMCDRVVHRGPDAEGLHVDARVGLGMRRLSIIDLAGGNQPIFNESGSLAVICNGEIYNFRELRTHLLERGHTFRTQSDTESIVHLYEDYGPRCVERLRGMFAFAVYDRPNGTVFFGRDRLGQKPLYWTEQDGVLYCASEMKSLFAVPAIRRTLDEVALDQYFSLVYVPGPRTIFREIKKLPPGSTLTKVLGRPAVVERYWRLQSRPDSRQSATDWVRQFRLSFDNAVRSHLVAGSTRVGSWRRCRE